MVPLNAKVSTFVASVRVFKPENLLITRDPEAFNASDRMSVVSPNILLNPILLRTSSSNDCIFQDEKGNHTYYMQRTRPAVAHRPAIAVPAVPVWSSQFPSEFESAVDSSAESICDDRVPVLYSSRLHKLPDQVVSERPAQHAPSFRKSMLTFNVEEARNEDKTKKREKSDKSKLRDGDEIKRQTRASRIIEAIVLLQLALLGILELRTWELTTTGYRLPLGLGTAGLFAVVAQSSLQRWRVGGIESCRILKVEMMLGAIVILLLLLESMKLASALRTLGHGTSALSLVVYWCSLTHLVLANFPFALAAWVCLFVLTVTGTTLPIALPLAILCFFNLLAAHAFPHAESPLLSSQFSSRYCIVAAPELESGHAVIGEEIMETSFYRNAYSMFTYSTYFQVLFYFLVIKPAITLFFSIVCVPLLVLIVPAPIALRVCRRIGKWQAVVAVEGPIIGVR
ncbi:hypothetical protein BDP27DRAFT_1368586 [Rhodocollybia butyracea]|uniref:Uncharacterized protein n=1 Tax=Rhodocollybia butyracea TaxID=206335 RepID=A0A9P5PF75_9AGAR|nr:hypothetical protein BDP27DRAFT_1368586 [Rhodocollybia butyracea]